MNFYRVDHRVDRILLTFIWIFFSFCITVLPFENHAQTETDLASKINASISDSLGAQLFATQFNYLNRKKIQV